MLTLYVLLTVLWQVTNMAEIEDSCTNLHLSQDTIYCFIRKENWDVSVRRSMSSGILAVSYPIEYDDEEQAENCHLGLAF